MYLYLIKRKSMNKTKQRISKQSLHSNAALLCKMAGAQLANNKGNKGNFKGNR